MASSNNSWKKYQNLALKINRLLRDAEKRGYRFSDTLYQPTKKENVANLDSAIAKLEAMTPEKIYADESTYFLVNPETGEVVSGTEGRQIERRIVALRGARTRAERAMPEWSEAVLQATYNNLDTLGSITWRGANGHKMSSSAAIVREAIDDIRERYGDSVAARVIVNMERNGTPINFDLLYNMDTVDGQRDFYAAFYKSVSKYTKIDVSELYDENDLEEI